MKIERNVPMPQPASTPAPRKERVPVENMEVGDSIYFPATKRQSAISRVHATALKARLKMTFRSAVEGDGARVWRIA